MNKEEFAVDEKTYENQDGLVIKIIFSNLGRRYKKIGNNLYLMLEKETTKLEDSLCNDLFSHFEQQISILEKLAEATDPTTDRRRVSFQNT